MIRRTLTRLLRRPRLHTPLPELTTQDQARVAALLDSDGWKVLSSFLDAIAANIEWQLISAPEDHRYWQGELIGLATALNVAEWITKQDLAEKKPQKTAEDLFFEKMKGYYG